MNIADQLAAANGIEPPTLLPRHWSLLFGFSPVPPRPAGAPVRTITPLASTRSAMPDLPRVTTTDPRLLRAQASRDAIYALLATGLYSRQQIADETGIDPDRVSDRLAELQDMGRVEYARSGRSVLWGAVDEDDEVTA